MTAQEWLDDLQAKTNAATPGPWVAGEVLDRGTVVHGHNMIIDCRHTPDAGGFGEHNAAFIAAANPQMVQRLVEMVKLATCLLECPYEDEKCPHDEDNTVSCAHCKAQRLYDLTEPKE